LGGIVLVAAASAVSYWFFTRSPQLPDPRLTYPTRYQNVRPDVAYVGDGRCLECHKNEAAHYSHHPMGQSLAPETDLLDHEELSADRKNPFEATGLQYQVFRRGNSLWHRERMLDSNKVVVYDKEVEVQYALGSGKLGRSYLHTKDGQVWQSPISWYSSAKLGDNGRWDLAPGYWGHNSHFEWPVSTDCLNCHSNRVEPIPGTSNRYQEPLFRGTSIGCERCHGPGQLHANTPSQPDCIVNPVRLEPVLREAVCEQCHLLGEQRVNRLGRTLSEYRPGLPLHAFISVGVPSQKGGGTDKAVGQVEQMHNSLCYQKSAGQFGCLSCHFRPDPKTPAHQLPAREHQRDYYRQCCLSCHDQSKGCSETKSKRDAKQDSCVACHMPPRTSSDIAHISLTDHTISRRPNAEPGKARPVLAEELPLALFHRDFDDPLKFTQDRDLAILLVNETSREKAPRLAVWAKPILDASLSRFPNDLDGLDALAHLQWLSGEQDESLGTLRRVLQLSPRRERTLQIYSIHAALANRTEEALALSKRLVEINPNNSENQFQLAKLLHDKKQLNEALAAAQTALRLNPANREVRRLLIRCHLDLGQKDLARAELQKYLAFKPQDAEVVKTWFDP
jgi:hypothetical protein